MDGTVGIRGVDDSHPNLVALRTATGVVHGVDATLCVELGVYTTRYITGEKHITRVEALGVITTALSRKGLGICDMSIKA